METEYDKIINFCKNNNITLGKFLTQFILSKTTKYSFSFFKEIIERGLEDKSLSGIDFNVSGYGLFHSLMIKTDLLDIKESVITWIIDKGINPNLNYFGYSEFKKQAKFIKSSFKKRGHNVSSGTILHTTLANENFSFKGEDFSKLKKYYSTHLILEAFKAKGVGFFNYNSQDIEEKTVINMASKMNATEIVLLLCKMKEEENFDINLDLADEKGNAPLHYAYALGNLESVKALIKAGANVNLENNKNETPKDFLNINEEALKGILKEMSIDPERSEGAFNNFIIAPDGISSGLLAQIKYKKCKKLFTDEYKKPEYEKNRKFDTNFVEKQFDSLTKKTFIEKCIEDRKKVSNFMESHEYKELLRNTKKLKTKKLLF